MKKIAVITGTRAEYGYLKPLMEKIRDSHNFELQVYVTGMHLVKEYGYTIEEIINDEFEITKAVDMRIKAKNTVYDMSVSVGEGVTGFSNAFNKEKCDLVVVFGDRIEPFAATISSVIMNIPTVHINGGDVGSSDIDNNLRHAITKLAHIHLTSSKKSKERVLKLGEEPWRVFNVGALSLDVISNKKLLTKEEIYKKYKISDKSLLVCYHPITTEWENAKKQMEIVMSAVINISKMENRDLVVIYPNASAGGHHIINIIKKYKKIYGSMIHIFKNLPHEEYLSLMHNLPVLIGNSSSGIIESPSLGTPVINIGSRQEGRERANNVIDVACNKQEIIKAITKALHTEDFKNIVKKCESPYGDGTASDKIVQILSKIKIDKKLLQKKITY